MEMDQGMVMVMVMAKAKRQRRNGKGKGKMAKAKWQRVLNKEFTECVVYFGCAKFVTKGHKGVFEHVCVDFAVDFEGIESLKDGIVIISTSGHLLCEKHDHLCEVDGSGGL